ncbi:LytR family transcriptional attenuator [Propionicimonas paludicola]|uniref:LytR family transcriptional attenuator n=1 Tax=Propionicimonas paludicola TaxID=185243 RepID=A0A2A9CST0_9ACTN|nr:LytR family transcriptional attenuator [Propionicimonas paludicola]
MLGDLEAGPARVEPIPVRRRRRRILLIVLLSAVLVVGLGAGAVVWKASSMLSGIARDPDMLPTPEIPVLPPTPDSPMNFLVAGADASDGGISRSDVLILGHISADRRSVYLMSLPRDLYVPIPGHGKNKINAAFAFGGMPLAVRTVEKLLDTHIEHAAWLDFDGLVAVSEKLGEITVWNSEASSVGPYHFARGSIRLSGDALLTFVRQRHGVSGGDLGRAERQRRVLKALAAKLFSKEALSHPTELLAVLDQLSGLVTVDASLTNEAIIDLAGSMHLDDGRSVVTMQVPIAGYGRSSTGQSIDLVDRKKLDRLIQALDSDSVDEYLDEVAKADSP